MVVELVECRGCGQPVMAQSSRCWRCGRAVVDALKVVPAGLGMMAQVTVIGSVFAVVLLGMVVLTQRQHAIDDAGVATARAVAIAEQEQQSEAERRAAQAVPDPTPTPTPAPPPDAGGPDTYTVQAGDSLFSVAADLSLSPAELVFWNRATYPTLESTPALKVGWVFHTTGAPLPTPVPRPTPQPTPEPQVARPDAPTTPVPQVAGPAAPTLPTFGSGSFPASHAVTVSYYAVSGSTPRQIRTSIQENGPWSDWLGRNAQAHVQVQMSFNFRFQGDGFGGCSVIHTSPKPVTITYSVLLPSWTPPASVSRITVDWWIDTIEESVSHEGHHITLYESFLTAMNRAVVTGSCASVEADLEYLWAEARLANCEFDVADYGYSVGLTLAGCLAN